MKKSKKIIGISIAGVILILFIILNIIILMSVDRILYHDNATFDDFSVYKVEEFYLKEDSEIKFTFNCNLKNGKVNVKILDSDEKIIIEYNDMNYNDIFKKRLELGTYYYVLKAENANGEFEYKAKIEKELQQ